MSADYKEPKEPEYRCGRKEVSHLQRIWLIFQAVDVTLGAGSPLVYEEAMADAAGSFYVKAEILNGGGWNGGFPNGYLTLTISHNCDVGGALRSSFY